MGIKEFGNGVRSDSHSLLYPQVAEGTMIPLVSVNLPTNRECSSFSLHSCSLQYHEGKTSSGQLKLFTLYCISWSRFIFTNRTRLTQWDRHVSNLLPFICILHVHMWHLMRLTHANMNIILQIWCYHSFIRLKSCHGCSAADEALAVEVAQTHKSSSTGSNWKFK